MTTKHSRVLQAHAIIAELREEAIRQRHQFDDDGPLAIPEPSPLDSAQARRFVAAEVV